MRSSFRLQKAQIINKKMNEKLISSLESHYVRNGEIKPSYTTCFKSSFIFKLEKSITKMQPSGNKISIILGEQYVQLKSIAKSVAGLQFKFSIKGYFGRCIFICQKITSETSNNERQIKSKEIQLDML